MSEKYNSRLCYKLEDELEKIADKDNLSAGDLETAHKLTDTIKNLKKIDMLKEAEDYSQRGPAYYQDGPMYEGRSSYQTRSSMGRYSRDGGYYGAAEDMRSHLDALERSASSDREREAVRDFRRKMER